MNLHNVAYTVKNRLTFVDKKVTTEYDTPMSTTETLQKIGLSEKEAKLYLTLLRHERMKPSELANLIKVSRPLVYSLAKGLLSKGLIAEDISTKTMYFTALPPSNLSRLVDELKRDAKGKEEFIKKAMSDLRLLTIGKQYPVPKLRLVEEKDLNKFLFDNLTKWQDQVVATDGVWWGFQDHTFIENNEKWIAATWETKQSKNPHYDARVFTNESRIEQKLEKKYGPKRNMKLLNDANFTATTWVCGDYLIMIMTQEHPFYLIEIHDTLMARNTAEIFKRLWNTRAE